MMFGMFRLILSGQGLSMETRPAARLIYKAQYEGEFPRFDCGVRFR
jgi:hypothetical protein